MPIRIQFFDLMQIWILLLIKLMGICDYWSVDPPGPHLSLQASIVSIHGTPRLCFKHLNLLYFDFNANSELQPCL
jgi:hypothetical protein